MDDVQIQSAGFLLELSPDWLILRASENAHGFLGQYHQRLIGEPLADFMLSQALHDLRNSLASQRSSSGIARVYHVRLFDDPRYFDIAFQSQDSRIILEGLPGTTEGHGGFMGGVSRLIEGLRLPDRGRTMEAAARRMRALTGFDRVTLVVDEERVTSNRGKLPEITVTGELPAIVADSGQQPIALFPQKDHAPIEEALLRAPNPGQLEQLRAGGIASALTVPVFSDGARIGYFECANGASREPSFELHAAAELFAQIFGMLLSE